MFFPSFKERAEPLEGSFFFLFYFLLHLPFHSLKTGVTLTYGTRQSLTYGTRETLTPFEAMKQAKFRVFQKNISTYSIGRIMLSIKATSSSVNPYFW